MQGMEFSMELTAALGNKQYLKIDVQAKQLSRPLRESLLGR